MNCVLCGTTIKEYNQEFNQLKIDETKTVEVCLDCIKKFVDWQREVFVKIYPTAQAKRWVRRGAA